MSRRDDEPHARGQAWGVRRNRSSQNAAALHGHPARRGPARWLLPLAAVFAWAGTPGAQAQTYPDHEIRLVLGFPAGGGSDLMTRYFAEKLRPLAGVPVIVENKPGASGHLAQTYVAKSRPDGYVVYIVGGTTLASGVHLFKEPPIDPLRDLEPITTLMRSPWVMTVDARKPFKTLPALTAFLKEKKDKASFGAFSTTGIVMGELYKAAADLQMVQVNYRAAGDALSDMLGGSIDVLFADVGFATGQTLNGKITPLAVSTATRANAMPDVPTLAEGGIPGIDLTVWWMIAVPAKTPQPVKDKLRGWFQQVLRMPETARFLATQGADVYINGPEETTALLRTEIDKWADYVRKAKLEPQ